MKTKMVGSSGQKRALRPSHAVTNLRQPTAVLDGDSAVVLVERRVQEFFLEGRAHKQINSMYLDGREVREQVDEKGRTVLRQANRAALPVRTEKIADFGRLDAAAVQMLNIMGRFDADSPPSPQDLENLLLSYENLLKWRADVQERIAQADGSINLVQAKILQLMQHQA